MKVLCSEIGSDLYVCQQWESARIFKVRWVLAVCKVMRISAEKQFVGFAWIHFRVPMVWVNPLGFLHVISQCEKILPSLFSPVITLTLFNMCAATCWCWTRPAGGRTCWLPCLCPTLLCSSRSHSLVTWGKTLHWSQKIQTLQLGFVGMLYFTTS